jgi:hypothetical protein
MEEEAALPLLHLRPMEEAALPLLHLHPMEEEAALPLPHLRPREEEAALLLLDLRPTESPLPLSPPPLPRPDRSTRLQGQVRGWQPCDLQKHD